MVLVVDDEPFVANLVREIIDIDLGPEGVQVQICTDATRAVDLVDLLHPDALILDLMMPDVDGFTILAAVAYKVPTLILSARVDVGDTAERCIAAGARRVLSKPFAIATIVEAVRTMLTEPIL